MALDYTVKIFDQFYNLDLVVNASEYEIVYSFFKEYSDNNDVAKSFTETLFRIANETQISVLDLLNTFKGSDKMKVSLTMAYYLNSLSNKTVLYGVNQVLVPNNLVQRNIIYDEILVSPITANFNRTPSSGCAPLTVTFTDTSSGAVTSWLWDFGDGNTSTAQNPTHTYTLPNTYTVLLTVSGAAGTDSISKSVVVSVAPVASFTRSPSSGCAPLTVNFTDTSTGTITGWLWDFGDGNTSTSQNPSHTYTLENVYTVSLTVSNGCGSDSDNSSVTVTAVPVASFTANPTSGEAPLTVTFTDTSTGTITGWLWDFGDSTTSTLQNPTHTYSTNGVFTVTLTVSNACGSDTANENISVSVACDPYFPYVSLLLHMDGTNGSTTFTDNSPSPKTVTANGIGQITTSVFKFGTGSFYTGLPGNTGWLQIPPSPDFIFGTGDFTIEGWFRPLSSGSDKVAFVHGVNTLGGLLVCVSINEVKFRAAGTNDLSVSVAISNTTFTHIAFVRSGNTRIIFVGGSQVASDTLSFNITDNVVTDIGASGNVGVNFRYDGYIDDFRITKGVARYTSNFTPPTAAFPDIDCGSSFSIPSGILVPETFAGLETFRLPTPAVVPETFTGLETFRIPCPPYVPLTVNGSQPPDPNFCNVVLLAHLDGVNGSWSVSDSSAYANTLTFTTTTPGYSLSTANPKFGTASTINSGAGTNEGINTPTSTLFAMGTGDFTIEYWYNCGDWGWGPARHFTLGGYYVQQAHPGLPYLEFNFGAGIAFSFVNGIVSNGVYQFFTIVRTGTVVNLYIDGILRITGSCLSDLGTTATNLRIHSGTPTPSYMDEFRVTKGVARYTSNFTPPTAPFPNS